MFMSEGLSPVMELVIWISYAVTILFSALTIGLLLECGDKEE